MVRRKEILHDSLPDSLYYKLVAGMIGETVNIANEIKDLKITTTKEEFEVWDNSLKSFELLGMKVGFLRDRIRLLARIVFESEGRVDIEKYTEAKNEQKRIEDEIKKVTERLVELNESGRKMEGVVDGLKQKVARLEMEIQKELLNTFVVFMELTNISKACIAGLESFRVASLKPLA
ncbi:hypothetical protein OSB04_000164 [Centaurea solstitialis]|uniref:Uncharacterized protein n=1 Tax=Centaurea solstitialis TaxID=347529 RepID=A0AA38TW14_9ASTR|nr:hypothetical protein OSB04_000164 [Centaurea solstitialis]